MSRKIRQQCNISSFTMYIGLCYVYSTILIVYYHTYIVKTLYFLPDKIKPDIDEIKTEEPNIYFPFKEAH